MQTRSVVLACSVRGCGQPLLPSADRRSWRCARAHCFDVARSGYLNLLQPNERRSRAPGDSEETVAARRRWMKSGRSAPLIEAVRERTLRLGLGRESAVLDVGCGEGTLLGSLQMEFGFEAFGVDISQPAIDAAARHWTDCGWIVANADIALPFVAESLDLVLSITARRHPQEFARVLKTGGHVLYAVPAEDDQVELRERLHGEAYQIDRLPALIEAMVGFELVESARCRWQNTLDRESYEDLLSTAYRGARDAQRARLERSASMVITSSYQLALFRKGNA
ncbi:MAG: methyltransferase domain-containing protein [Planctomycetia bacterium]